MSKISIDNSEIKSGKDLYIGDDNTAHERKFDEPHAPRHRGPVLIVSVLLLLLTIFMLAALFIKKNDSSLPIRSTKSNHGVISIHIKGLDDGVKTTKQNDFKEATLFAKREAIERAGVEIKSLTTVKDLVLQQDYIESKSEGILLPGYEVVDVGYDEDGTYNVVLIGKIKSQK